MNFQEEEHQIQIEQQHAQYYQYFLTMMKLIKHPLFPKPNNEPLFQPHEDLEHYKKKDWIEMTDEVFNVVFKESPLKRTKYKGLKRNINYAGQQV